MALIENPADVIKHIIETEIGADNISLDQASYDSAHSLHQSVDLNTTTHPMAFTVHDKQINSKKLIEGIASNSFLMPYFKENTLYFQGFFPNPDYMTDLTDSIPGGAIDNKDIISYKNKRTASERIYTKVVVNYNYDYALKEFSGNTSTDINNTNADTASQFFNEGVIPDPHGSGQTYDLANLGLSNEQELIFDAHYIRSFTSASALQQFLLLWNCNQHNILNLRLPLKYIKLKIGDFVEFDKMINNVKLFGEDYSHAVNYSYSDGTDNKVFRNAQEIYPIWMVTSSNKTLTHIDIELIQMHNCTPDVIPSIEVPPADPGDDDSIVTYYYGCIDETAYNYGEDANNPGNLMPDEEPGVVEWRSQPGFCTYEPPTVGPCSIELEVIPDSGDGAFVEAHDDGTWDIYLPSRVGDWSHPSDASTNTRFLLRLINNTVDIEMGTSTHYLFFLAAGSTTTSVNWHWFEGGEYPGDSENNPVTIPRHNFMYNDTVDDIFDSEGLCPPFDESELTIPFDPNMYMGWDNFHTNMIQIDMGGGDGGDYIYNTRGDWLSEWLASPDIPEGTVMTFWKGLIYGLMVPDDPWTPRIECSKKVILASSFTYLLNFPGYWDPVMWAWWANNMTGGEDLEPPPYTEFPAQPDYDSICFPEFRIHKGLPLSSTPVDYNDGWNFVSSPVTDSYDIPYGGIFPGSFNNALYGYDGTAYILESEMEIGKGYWLNFDGATTVTLHGTPIIPTVWEEGQDATLNNSIYITLHEGFNLIGCPGDTCDIYDPTVSGFNPTLEFPDFGEEGNILVPGFIYGFDGTYIETLPYELQAGRAYWVKAKEAGVVLMRRRA